MKLTKDQKAFLKKYKQQLTAQLNREKAEKLRQEKLETWFALEDAIRREQDPLNNGCRVNLNTH